MGYRFRLHRRDLPGTPDLMLPKHRTVGGQGADRRRRAPAWDEDVARDCIRKLGGEPSPENVRRIINLRVTAGWLRIE